MTEYFLKNGKYAKVHWNISLAYFSMEWPETLVTFTADDVVKVLEKLGYEYCPEDVKTVLSSRLDTFQLLDGKFTNTVQGFKNYNFSFKLTEEEIELGYFLLGDRVYPFTGCDSYPIEPILVYTKNSKGKLINIKPHVKDFSRSLVLDNLSLFTHFFSDFFNHSIYGADKWRKSWRRLKEGVFKTFSIMKDVLNFEIPEYYENIEDYSTFPLFAYKISDINGGKKAKVGDRVLCSIWWDKEKGPCILAKVISYPNPETALSVENKRKEWNKKFKEAFYDTCDKLGSMDYAFRFYSLLFLLHRDELDVDYCGSLKECLSEDWLEKKPSFLEEPRYWFKDRELSSFSFYEPMKGKTLLVKELERILSEGIVKFFIKYANNECWDDYVSLVDNVMSLNYEEDVDSFVLNMKIRRGIIGENKVAERVCYSLIKASRFLYTINKYLLSGILEVDELSNLVDYVMIEYVSIICELQSHMNELKVEDICEPHKYSLLKYVNISTIHYESLDETVDEVSTEIDKILEKKGSTSRMFN